VRVAATAAAEVRVLVVIVAVQAGLRAVDFAFEGY
jgi:hypothetical protein